jgi:hypothetical protein
MAFDHLEDDPREIEITERRITRFLGMVGSARATNSAVTLLFSSPIS